MNDKEYRKWIQIQPSCISGEFYEWIDGEGYSIAAHVRRTKWGAGVSIKPSCCYVPLGFREHALQHQYGETYFHPTEWWEEQVLKYQKLYLEQSTQEE